MINTQGKQFIFNYLVKYGADCEKEEIFNYLKFFNYKLEALELCYKEWSVWYNEGAKSLHKYINTGKTIRSGIKYNKRKKEH